MITIGKYQFGFAPFSMIIVFVVLSAYAVITSIRQYTPQYPMPLSLILLVNEGIALVATLVYGIIAQLTLAIIKWIKRLE